MHDRFNIEKVYIERANGKWEYWTYSDMSRIFISKLMADKMVSQGAILVRVN